MSKKIKYKYELRKILRNARLWFVGAFMYEFLSHREMWENPETKGQFVSYMYNEFCSGFDDISTTATSVNAVIRIIESGMVIPALELVINSGRVDKECEESKVNAQWVLDMIKNGEILLQEGIL